MTAARQIEIAPVRVTLGDGIDGMQSIPGEAAMVLSDLPSGETRAAFDVVPDLPRFWAATWKALRSNGVAVLMASSIRFAATLIDSQPRAFRYDLVWSKSIAVGFLNAKHRPLRSHEFVLVFARGAHPYFPQMLMGSGPINTNSRSGARGTENYGTTSMRGGVSRAGAWDRFPRSVLQFASVATRAKNRRHPQQKPTDLWSHLIRTHSEAGDLIVDPFAGSGSVGVAAAGEGRRFLGWDSDPRFGGEA